MIKLKHIHFIRNGLNKLISMIVCECVIVLLFIHMSPYCMSNSVLHVPHVTRRNKLETNRQTLFDVHCAFDAMIFMCM